MGVIEFEPRLVEKRLADALASDEAGDVHGALGIVRSVLRRHPGEARANALAALYSALLDRHRQALIYSSKALACDGVDGEVAYWCAVSRHIAGAQQLALDALEIALARNPNDGDALVLADRCRTGIARA